ncbi:MAG: hypothetical protein EGQ20_06570 [Bacteroides oleiciplenus]|nr:hypothetical protein [Bacteroides oleiciplenus]
MKPLFKRLAGVAAIAAVLYSCASIGRPEGGAYDETPPRFVSSTPAPGALNNNRKRISIEFDEFIKLEKPGEKIVISPPQVQQPEIKSNGKKVIINLKDSLKPNTTYTIDFSDAIQDNNEGNPLPDFGFTFSTGTALDSMVVSGTVLNASNLEPVKGMLVGMHSDLADSAFTTKPFERVGRTDSRGRFTIRGVAPGEYRIYGLQDADQNFYYSQPSEILAFEDSLIIPSMDERIRFDTLWVDSLTIDTIVEKTYTHYSPDDVILRCFKELTSSQRLIKSERPEPRKFSFYFSATADSLPLLKGLNFDETDAFIVEMPTGRIDTLTYWIRDSLVYQMDTLKMSLSYLYTDTLNKLVPRTDTLKLVSKLRPKSEKELEKEREKKEKEVEKAKKKAEKEGKEYVEPTIFLPVDVYAPGTMDIYDYITFTFTEPLASMADSAIHLRQKVDSLWQDVAFDFVPDSLNLMRYNVYADWNPGESYTLEVDSMAFHGIYGMFTDKIKKEFKVKKPEEYGQIFYNVSGADSVAFVELLDGQDKVVRTVPVVDGKADFYYLNPGKYGARLINDTNGNGVWDTGKYEDKRQPEKVYYYHQVIELKANFDLTQTWNIHERPLDKQKPVELKKQKPDEDKKKKNQNNRNSGNRR